MFDGHSFSVIITTYRRYDTLGSVIQGWLNNSPDQLWVIDNNSKYQLNVDHMNAGVKLFSMPMDFKTRPDYALATLTDGDFIIFADDDAIPEPGFIEDLYNGWKMVGGIVGVIGRQFTSDEYIKCKHYRAEKIASPVRTGSIGIIYMTPRDYICFDTRGMHRIDDDLWWLMKCFPRATKHVIPTKKYVNLSTGSDSGCLFHAGEKERKIRQDCYFNYYTEFYKPFNLIW